MAKHRSTVYAVVRFQVGEGFGFVAAPAIIGVYHSIERAEEIAGRSAQEMKDHGVEGFKFQVQATAYYDE